MTPSARAIGLVLACAAVTTNCRRASDSDPQRAPAASRTRAPAACASFPERGAPAERSLADVAAQVTPSVVNVVTARELAVPGHHVVSLGSGVILQADGVIVTNQHVVDTAEAIIVVLKDGREMKAKLIGSDERSDVAVLRVDARELPAIELGDSRHLRVGDRVLAIGNPFGIGQTVTFGIISATGRANLGINDIEDFIQTDAAINPGNSGGALVDMDGRLVGLNTAIVSRTGGYQGISFAIPSNMMRQVTDQIVEHGKVIRGYLGVVIEDTSASIAARAHVPAHSGVLVAAVSPSGPAAHAGLVRGDIIVAIDGARVADSAHLKNVVALSGPQRVTVQLLRAGRTLYREVTLAEPPATAVDIAIDDADTELTEH